jgi:thymidylate kinase
MRGVMDISAPADVVNSRRALFRALIGVLNDANVPWCIAHGHEKYARDVPTDFDCIIARQWTPAKLAALLKSRESELNARVVQWLNDGAQWIVLASNDHLPTFLQLHASYDYELASRMFYSGDEILASRRQVDDLWVASPEIEFGCVLANRIAKSHLDEQRQQRLVHLFEQDSTGCARQISHLLAPSSARLISMAARTGEFAEVHGQMPILRADLLARGKRVSVIGHWARRIQRWLKPDCGLHVVFLGPDGVGKSTVIEAVRDHLADAFLGVEYRTFAPSLIPQRFQQEKKTPHELPPRSYFASLLKAAWWAVCYTLLYMITLRPPKARGRFVMNHRYLLDAIVDRKRYRYSGPQWMLKAIWAIAPKPDLIVLLDAEAETIWARKKEVALEETIRQRESYRALVEPLKFGKLVEASQPVEKVVADVDKLILDLLATRVSRRVGMEASACNCRPP